MDPLGAVLVVVGVAIALCALLALAVVAVVVLQPWSRLRPRYQRGVPAPPVRTSALQELAAAGARRARALPALIDRPRSRHPRGARHLVSLLHGR